MLRLSAVAHAKSAETGQLGVVNDGSRHLVVGRHHKDALGNHVHHVGLRVFLRNLVGLATGSTNKVLIEIHGLIVLGSIAGLFEPFLDKVLDNFKVSTAFRVEGKLAAVAHFLELRSDLALREGFENVG